LNETHIDELSNLFLLILGPLIIWRWLWSRQGIRWVGVLFIFIFIFLIILKFLLMLLSIIIFQKLFFMPF